MSSEDKPGFAPGRPPGSGPVKPPSDAYNRDLQRLQALQMLMERASGASIPDLATKYQLDPDRIEDRLSGLWKEGYLKELEDAMLERLAPLVMAVYEAQLKLGSIDAARDIGGTLGIIKRPGQKDAKPDKPTKAELVVDSIETYRKMREANRLKSGERRPSRLITPEVQ